MANEPEKPRQGMGVYDRPASADRPSPWIWVAVVIVVLVIAYFVVQHFHLFGGGAKV